MPNFSSLAPLKCSRNDCQHFIYPLVIFSHSADPYVAAENFLTANDLPAHYLDEVAQFIIKNAGEYRGPPSAGVTDPFTGMGLQH